MESISNVLEILGVQEIKLAKTYDFKGVQTLIRAKMIYFRADEVCEIKSIHFLFLALQRVQPNNDTLFPRVHRHAVMYETEVSRHAVIASPNSQKTWIAKNGCVSYITACCKSDTQISIISNGISQPKIGPKWVQNC